MYTGTTKTIYSFEKKNRLGFPKQLSPKESRERSAFFRQEYILECQPFFSSNK